MKKVRERRSFGICLDSMRKWEIDIVANYVNGDFSELKEDIESRFNLTEVTQEIKTEIDKHINVIDVVFFCVCYYNKLDDLCEIEIIEFL